MKTPLSDLGRNLRHFRVAGGINQRELSDRTGLSQATISRVEAGLVRQVRSETLQALAAALHVSVDDLVAPRAATLRLQHRLWLDEAVARLRREGVAWISLDPEELLARAVAALVKHQILHAGALYLAQADRAHLSLVGNAAQEGYEMRDALPPEIPWDEKHPVAVAARRGQAQTNRGRGPTGAMSLHCLPLARGSAATAVLVTWAPRGQGRDARLRLEACAPFLQDLGLVLEVAGRITGAPGDHITPWTRAAVDPVAVVCQDIVIDADEGFCQLTGYSRHQLLGLELRKLLTLDEAQVQPGADGEEGLTLRADGVVAPVVVRRVRRSFGPRAVQVTTVRDDTARRHQQVVAQVERSFLEAAPDDLEAVLQSCFAELTALGVDLLGVGINLLEPGEKSFVAHTLLAPERVYVDELREETTEDYPAWHGHWQRRAIWARPFPESKVHGYRPHEVIDVPFREGTLAVGIGKPKETYPSFLPLLGSMALAISAGLRRMRLSSPSTDRLLRAAWDATEAPAALLDSRGVVRDCNAAWSLAGGAIGIGEGGPLGVDFLRLCQDRSTVCHERFGVALRGVLGGTRIEVSDCTPCHGDCPLAGTAPGGHACRVRAVRVSPGGRSRDRFVLFSFQHVEEA